MSNLAQISLVETIDLRLINCPECKKRKIWQDTSVSEFVCCSCGIIISEREIIEQFYNKRKGRRKP